MLLAPWSLVVREKPYQPCFLYHTYRRSYIRLSALHQKGWVARHQTLLPQLCPPLLVRLSPTTWGCKQRSPR